MVIAMLLMALSGNAQSQPASRAYYMCSANQVRPLAASAAAPTSSPSPAAGIEIQPRKALDFCQDGPTAQLFNGSVLSAAAKSLRMAEAAVGTLSNFDRIAVSQLNGGLLLTIGSASKLVIAAVRISGEGRMSIASDIRPVGKTIVSVPVSYVRSFEAVQQYYNSPNRFPAYVTDRDLSDYDVLIFRSGTTYDVYVSHHTSGMQVYLGCFDGAGYSGTYIVDAETFRAWAGRNVC